MKRAALSMFLVLVAAALSGTLAGAQPTQADSAQAAPKKQKALIGFYRNRTVNYFDYGRIKLRPGNKLAPIWVFSNGADGQRSIVNSAPGRPRQSRAGQRNPPHLDLHQRRRRPEQHRRRRSRNHRVPTPMGGHRGDVEGGSAAQPRPLVRATAASTEGRRRHPQANEHGRQLPLRLRCQLDSRRPPLVCAAASGPIELRREPSSGSARRPSRSERKEEAWPSTKPWPPASATSWAAARGFSRSECSAALRFSSTATCAAASTETSDPVRHGHAAYVLLRSVQLRAGQGRDGRF